MLQESRLWRVQSLLRPHAYNDGSFSSSLFNMRDICVDDVDFDIRRIGMCGDFFLGSRLWDIHSTASPDDQRLLELVYHHGVCKSPYFTGYNHSDFCEHHNCRSSAGWMQSAWNAFTNRNVDIPHRSLNNPERSPRPTAEMSSESNEELKSILRQQHDSLENLLMHQFTLEGQIQAQSKQIENLTRMVNSVLENQASLYLTDTSSKLTSCCFLSHAGADKGIAVFLSFVLERAKIPCFLDIRDINDVSSESIYAAIRESDVFFVIGSENYSKSNWCTKEFVAAEALPRRIIVFRPGDNLLFDKYAGNDLKGDMCDRLLTALHRAYGDHRQYFTRQQFDRYLLRSSGVVWTSAVMDEWRSGIVSEIFQD